MGSEDNRFLASPSHKLVDAVSRGISFALPSPAMDATVGKALCNLPDEA